MTAVAHIAIDSSARITAGGMLLGGALSIAADNVAIRRYEAATSVAELALRLREARAHEAAAVEAAIAAQAELAQSRAEAARLRLALAAERASKAELQDLLQGLCAEIEGR
ncbi:hypothetical protein [Methylobacterium aquaticum]|uniref:hypothetical protein n=1 Tax=Methylobacterium aquaticum TaxID=270351 RepID=UPI001932A5A4|nr:hypothetical protein [Methylobacterium aquaticum]QRE76842.1 hypothetical protein F1D61_27765 [Methylobacterium aquaticum]